MICKGKLKNIFTDFVSGRHQVTFEVEADPAELEKYSGKDLSIEIKQYRNRRSLEANAYHYALCTQIAKVLDVTVAFVHNTLLRECGYLETIGGRSVLTPLPDTEQTANDTLEASTYHLAPTDEVRAGNDGVIYRTYALLRGSHDFDTAEMSHLIDRTIERAKECGIETLTPDQQAEMMASYAKYHAGR